MGLFDHFPYTNFHELNLTWLLVKVKELENTVNNFVALNTIKYADPIQWNITTQYEANTVVVDPQSGTAYISTKAVPTGVAISNTDYWSVIFTLDIISANKNLTLRDDGSNVLATFASAAGDWLLWNGTLYKVSQAINVNEAYVDGYNLTRYTVELFLKEYIDDLSLAINTIIGDLADLTTSDTSSIVNALNSVLSDLGNIIGDLADLSTTDKSSIVNALNEVYNMIDSLDLSYLGNILKADESWTGSKSGSYWRKKDDIVVDTDLVTLSDIELDGLEIIGNNNPTMNIDGAANIRHSKINSSGTISQSIAITGQNVDGVYIHDNNIEAQNYPVLLNESNGKDVAIYGNRIKSRNSDGIELNTPFDNTYGVRVFGNFIEAGSTGATGDCLGIGIASGHDVIAFGNTVYDALKDGLHIEHNSENIIASENIFNNCLRYGASIGNTSRTDGINNFLKVENNIFKAENQPAGSCGIFLAFSASSDVNKVSLRDNFIEGFEIGLYLVGLKEMYTAIDCDGTYIKNCTTPIGTERDLYGNIFIEGLTNPIGTGNNASIESLIFLDKNLDIDNIVQPASNTICSIQRLKYSRQLTGVVNGTAATIPLFKIPKYAKGTIRITLCGNQSYTNPAVVQLMDFDSTSGTPIVNSTNVLSYGSIGGSFSVSGGYIVHTGSTHPSGTLDATVEFTGMYVI